MIKYCLFFFLLISLSIHSQEYTIVDERVKTYPRYSKVIDLAKKIKQDFTSDEEKVRAAFFWLTKNIRYNLKQFYNPKQRSISFKYATEEEKNRKLQTAINKLVDITFLTKQGVCEEYAQSFKKICDLLEIESEVIKGYVRNDASEIGKIENAANHAWNAVKLNGSWVILDVTWAAGYEYNGKWIRKFDPYFYNIPPKKIFKTHFPEDVLWVLRFGRMSLKEFYNQPIYGNGLLNSDTEFISPASGIIKINLNESIQLKFKNLNTKSFIYYTFTGMKYLQKPILSIENNTTTLTIKNPQRNSNLKLFINKEAVLKFKTQ